jgi:hypothetical protein
VREGGGNDVVVDVNVTPTDTVIISAIEAFHGTLLVYRADAAMAATMFHPPISTGGYHLFQ